MSEVETPKEEMGAYVQRIIGASLRGIGYFVSDQLNIVWRAPRLFLGALFVLVGLLDLEVGKFCDGNTAEYLSCTRPTVYYYFDSLDKILIILGVFFLLTWYSRHE